MKKKWINAEGIFTKMSAEQVKELSSDEQSEYVLDLMKNTVENEVSKLNLADKAEIEKLQTEIKEMKDSDTQEKLDAKIAGLQKTVKSLKSNRLDIAEEKSILEQVKEQQKEGESFDATKLEAKIKVNKATATTINAITDNTMNYRIPGVSRTPSPKFTMTDIFPTVKVSDPNSFDELSYVDWDESSITRAAATRAEDGTVAESTLVMIEKTVSMKYIADSMTLTRAAQRAAKIFTRDLDFFLEDNMARAENAQLYNGDGTGNNLTGLYTRVNAFNYAAYSGKTIQNANVGDLVFILKKEIMKGKSNKTNGYNVDFCLLSWDDYMDMSGGLKDANDNYIVPPMHGVTFIPSSFVADNTLVVGDSSKAKIYETLNYDYEIGYKSGNFEKRLPSIIVETAKQFLIREADLDAFYKVTSVSDAKTAVST